MLQSGKGFPVSAANVEITPGVTRLLQHQKGEPSWQTYQEANDNSNGSAETINLKQAIADWQESSMALRESMGELLATLEAQQGEL